MHPNKIHLQQSWKGVKYVGVVFKHRRNYISNRTVGHCYDTINTFNKIADKQGNTLKFTQSVNSYFGSMVNLSSYNVRKRLFSIIDKEWFQHIYFVGYKKALIKKK